jgi:hypothetical protein
MRPGMQKPPRMGRLEQARQESNLQPPVLETGALPIELRTYDALREEVTESAVCVEGSLFVARFEPG